MGFAMQSFFIGIGAYFASKLPLIFTYGVQNTAPLGVIQIQLNTPLPGGIIFIVTVLWTVITSKEYSPEGWKLLKNTKETTFIKEEFSADWYITNGHSHLTKGILFLIVSVLFSM
jgi:maltose/moltooligosaccharide transporter